MKETALKYCYKNPVLHMDIIVPIKRNTAEIIYSGTDGVVIKETKSGAYLMALDSYKKALDIFHKLDNSYLYSVKNKDLATYIMDKTRLCDLMEANQFTYLKQEKLKNDDILQIKELDETYKDIIISHYTGVSDPSYIIERIENKELYGGFFEEKFCAFIGFHAEGSMGMLYVFPEFRKKGFATKMQIYMTNLMLDMGLTPFNQVEIYNTNSRNLQEKLGFEMSEEKVYWIS